MAAAIFVTGNLKKSGKHEDIFTKMPLIKCTTCNICTCVQRQHMYII